MKKMSRIFQVFFLFAFVAVSITFAACNNNSKAGAATPVPVDSSKKDSIKLVEKTKAGNEAYDPSKYNNKYDDMAKFFAGMETDSASEFAPLFKTQGWKNYSNGFSNRWNNLEKKRLAPIREWATTELKDISTDCKTLFYPFGGPDFLFANTFFPSFDNFVLIGLEPVGQLPDLNKLDKGVLNNYLGSLQGSLRTLIDGGFFKTIDMASDFRPGRVNGTVPVLLTFLAKTGNKVLDIEYITLDKTGKLTYEKSDLSEKKQKKNYQGVLIKFTDKEAKTVKKLFFFSTDLSNGGFPKHKDFQEFVLGLKPFASMAKAASYLMHEGNFSSIRSFVTDNAQYMLQEDSGIPVKYFDAKKWERRFYGTYHAPIPLFAGKVQRDLQLEFNNKGNVKPLPFGIGYYWESGRSNLMFGIKK
jgi:hypothetical protein